MRQRKLIIYPTLNDKGGDVTKDWYVEYAFRISIDGKQYKYRCFQGLCRNVPAKERYANAQILIAKYTDFLRSGAYLNSDGIKTPVMLTEDYRPEVKQYKETIANKKVRRLVDRFLDELKPTLRPASFRKYRGEFNIFCDWVELNLHDKCAEDIERSELQAFLNYLAADPDDGGRGLCHESILQYRMRINAFFLWLVENDIILTNPAHNLRAGGKYVDCSPTLYTMDERKLLKDAILPRQPYLWLAIELLYYSAIRPGECRQLRIGDVDREKKEITIHNYIAKNKTSQKVGVMSETIALMERLGVFCYPPEYYIFGRGGIPGTMMLGKSTMRERFLQYRRALGIDDSRTLYAWKHTGITELIQNGADIVDVKDHARHADIKTTMEYAKKRVPKTHAFEAYLSNL